MDKIYCSLDIETSGFDPLKNEVLEIGFVFFVEDRGKGAGLKLPMNIPGCLSQMGKWRLIFWD